MRFVWTFILLCAPVVAIASGDVIQEATGPAGAIVTFSIGSGPGEDENGRPINNDRCAPAPGSMFPLGTTLVRCASTSFEVTVVDTTAPLLVLPAAIASQENVVHWRAAARDLVDGEVQVSCTPPSGSTFDKGTTSVACTASDSRLNEAKGTFTVTVSDTPPPPSVPDDITVEATSAAGAVVTYRASASGTGDDENGRPIENTDCSPRSGSMFPLGTSVVTCSTSGGSASFKVHVVDTRGPALKLPRDFTVPGSDAGATVTYDASAEDVVDGSVAIDCSPPSGFFFAAGTTTVECTASDRRNNATAGSFTITVSTQQPPPPPQFPHDITREATGPNGAEVTYAVTGGAGDDENGRPVNNGNCAPASGSTFPLGTTLVQCSGGSFKVTIVDTTAPALVLPPDIKTETANSSGTNVTFSATASDIVDGAVQVSCAPSSGSNFEIGTTTVRCSASDSRNNSADGAFTITVEYAGDRAADKEAPTIVSIAASPDQLTPPNGKLVPVTISVEVIDNLDQFPYVGIFEVTSNESIDTTDYAITGPLTVELRAERDSHESGRIYTIFVEAIDDAGNRSTEAVAVTVPHDQGNGSAPATLPSRRRAVRR